MTPRPAKRLLGKHLLELLRRATDAQRHRNLTFAFVARPSQGLAKALRLLGRLGVIAHSQVGRPRWGGPAAPRHVTCTLRYWEGDPLVRVASTPQLLCSYHDLARRATLGAGATLLVWEGGELRTGGACLASRRGGLLVATLTA